METVQQDLKMVESSQGDAVLHLMSGYLSKLLNNKNIRRYLSQHCAEILSEFVAIVSATSLDQSVRPADLHQSQACQSLQDFRRGGLVRATLRFARERRDENGIDSSSSATVRRSR